MRLFSFHVFLCAILFSAAPAFGAKVVWKPVSPEELAETKPHLEADAPAEVVFWTIEVDDREFPRERKVTEYIRYKIFEPTRTEAVTRISGLEVKGTANRNQFQARLVLPGGKAQEFGRESIQERTLAQQGRAGGFLGWLGGSGVAVTEKFLAVPGVEAGAVLEFQTTRIEPYPSTVAAFTAQREGIPVRQFDYLCRLAPASNWYLANNFVLNSRGAKLTEDPKARTVVVTASDLPPIVREPFVGPATDYSLTILLCYEQTQMILLPRTGKVPMPATVPGSLGPWAGYATLMNWAERDRGVPTPRLKQLADNVTAPAASELEKAQRIHRQVRAMFQGFRGRTPGTGQLRGPTSVDDVIDWKSQPGTNFSAEDFLWLAVALYQAAGFEAHTIMLPNRSLARFDPKAASKIFLSNLGIAVRVDGEWRLSMPQYAFPLPFGMVPWQQEGQVGLLALERKQEFIPVPPTPSEQSQIATRAKLQLDEEGGLTGEVTRRYTGHAAMGYRQELREAAAGKDREEVARKKLGVDLKVVDVTVTKMPDLDDVDVPLEVIYRIQWPNYAVRLKDRLIVRPSVFHSEAKSPFTATERHNPVHFPYRWQEMDQVDIQAPVGYQPESPSAPQSAPGKVLHYAVDLGYAREQRRLVLRRDFTSNLIDLPKDKYEALKGWYASVEQSDQHEVVFNKAALPPAAPAEKP